ncbi:helix-turn-helix domain-containing protein [Sediminispirochaeta bajacaliforniensis]|uniref:helix-turn-helix domain-containing protein n=1 Tax=Sediminispirochaeta bajacaliforniensis TaxID=148 RepID=UPI00036A7406
MNSLNPLSMNKTQRELLDRILSYVDQHLADPGLTPQQIADGCNISLRHLHRIFSTTNTSVSQWITKRRLEQCWQDLAKTGQIAQTVTDIAFRWGFNDVSHFNRAFKRTFQITPSQHRKTAES